MCLNHARFLDSRPSPDQFLAVTSLCRRRYTDNDLCFSLLTGSPESANFTNTFSEVFPMLLRMTEDGDRTALMILSTAPGASVVLVLVPM